VESMSSALTYYNTLCMGTDSAGAPRVRGMYPKLTWLSVSTDIVGFDEVNSRSGQCDGLLSVKNQYEAQRGDPRFCNLRLVETIAPDAGGWVTNRASACVAQAIEWGMAVLKVDGALDNLFSQFNPVVPCGTASGADEGRRLATASSASGSGSGTAGDSEGEEDMLDVGDFWGLFVLWLVATVGVISWEFVVVHHARRLTDTIGTTVSDTAIVRAGSRHTLTLRRQANCVLERASGERRTPGAEPSLESSQASCVQDSLVCVRGSPASTVPRIEASGDLQKASDSVAAAEEQRLCSVVRAAVENALQAAVLVVDHDGAPVLSCQARSLSESSAHAKSKATFRSRSRGKGMALEPRPRRYSAV